MKTRSLLSLLIIAFSANAQHFNYLPNPGFEAYQQCPDENQFNGYLEDWVATSIFGSPDASAGRYYNACNSDIWNWPQDGALEEGAVRVSGALITGVNVHIPGFIYAELRAPLEKDSLYYFEYTSASNSFLFEGVDFPDLPRDNWCISPDVGFAFTTTPPEVDTVQPLVAYATTQMAANQFGSAAIQIGQCYRATGEEKYFVFGQFFGQADDRHCYFDQQMGQHLQFGEVMDNFILEELEPQLCCDTFFCQEQEVDFTRALGHYILPAFREDSFVWNDGVLGKRRVFNQTGDYFLTINMACGSKRTNAIHVEVGNCANVFAIPNAFSPNDDGINDFFKPEYGVLYGLVHYQLMVFDRWGNQVFQSQNINDQGWDGTQKGKPVSNGVYVWTLSYTMELSNLFQTERFSGDVLLIR